MQSTSWEFVWSRVAEREKVPRRSIPIVLRGRNGIQALKQHCVVVSPCVSGGVVSFPIDRRECGNMTHLHPIGCSGVTFRVRIEESTGIRSFRNH